MVLSLPVVRSFCWPVDGPSLFPASAAAERQKLLSSAAIFVAFISFANQGSAPLVERSGVFCCEGLPLLATPTRGAKAPCLF